MILKLSTTLGHINIILSHSVNAAIVKEFYELQKSNI